MASLVTRDFFSSLPQKWQHTIAILFLFLLPVILFSPVVFENKTLVTHDIEQYVAMAKDANEHYKDTKEKTFWTHNMFSGMPTFTITNPTLNPHIDTVIYRFLSLIKVNHPINTFWILLIGAYLLGIILDVRPSIAVIGAISIGFMTYIPVIIGAGHNSKFQTFAWVPWIFSFYSLYMNKGNKLIYLALFTLVFFFNLKAGHPQVSYYMFYLLVIWWVFDSTHLLKQGQKKTWILLSAGLLLAGLTSAGGYLSSLWPMQEYSELSMRGGSALASSNDQITTTGLSMDYAFAWSQGWYELLTLIFPNAVGGTSSTGLYWGPKAFTSGPHYFGFITWLFLLPALFVVKDYRKWVFFTAGTVGLIFSLGENFTLINGFAYNYIPLYDKFRTPEMWLILTGFSYSALAIMGLEALLKLLKEKVAFTKVAMKPIGAALALLLLATFMVQWSEPTKAGERQQIASMVAQQNQLNADNPQVVQYVSRYLGQLKEQRKEAAQQDVVRVFIFVSVVLIALYSYNRQKISADLALIIAIGLLSYDLLSVGGRYISEQQYETKPDTDASMYEVLYERKKRPLDDYIIQNAPTEEGWWYRTYRLDTNAFNTADQAYYYPLVGGYNAAKLSIYQDLISNALIKGPFGFNPKILNMLNAKYLVAPQGNLPLEGYRSVYQQGNRQVIENQNVLPKAWFVEKVEIAGSPREAMDFVASNSFEPSTTAIVETAEDLSTTYNYVAEDTLSVTSYQHQKIVLEYSSSEEAFIVLSEVYYPAGWKAFIGEQEIPIYKTNYALRGLAIPAGSHTVEMRFEAETYKKASTVGVIANGILILLFVGGFYQMYSRRKKSTFDEDHQG